MWRFNPFTGTLDAADQPELEAGTYRAYESPVESPGDSRTSSVKVAGVADQRAVQAADRAFREADRHYNDAKRSLEQSKRARRRQARCPTQRARSPKRGSFQASRQAGSGRCPPPLASAARLQTPLLEVAQRGFARGVNG